MNRLTDDERFKLWETTFPNIGNALSTFVSPFAGLSTLSKKGEKTKPTELSIRELVFWTNSTGIVMFTEIGPAFLAVQTKLEDSIEARLGQEVESLIHEDDEDALIEVLGIDLGGKLAQLMLSEGFWVAMLYSCIYIIAEKPERACRFQPLLNLWKASIMPLGFDAQNRLILLAPDKASQEDPDDTESIEGNWST